MKILKCRCDYCGREQWILKPTNGDRIKSMSNEELADEIKLIANWDRNEKAKAERDPNFYLDWVKKVVG